VKLLLPALAALTALTVPAAPPPVVYYVAPTGSDQASGKLAASFATLEHARDMLRTQKHTGAPVTIYLRGGSSITYVACKHDRPPRHHLAEWRTLCFDKDSIVANPLFVAGQSQALAGRLPEASFLQHLPGGIISGSSHDSAAGMRTGAAEK
jgi:hypothetical protein